MLKLIDNILNKITMYRLVLYYLIFLLSAATLLSFFKILPFQPTALVLSTSFLVIIAWISNTIFAKTFEAVTNFESVYITSLILALIISPVRNFHDLPFLGWAAILAMASKYIFALNKKHLFNPVAISVVLTALVLNQSASWWVGTFSMLPFVLAGGLLVVRKTRRSDMVFSFIFVSVVTILGLSLMRNSDLVVVARHIIFDSPLLFFAFVLLTEPLTTPPTQGLQVIYGGLVGFLFSPQIHLGNYFTTPEIALVLGNIFSYLASPKEKLILQLKQRLKVSPDIYDFLFFSKEKLAFTPGQYLEFTLGQKNIDSRGNRRYFTLASSPTESYLSIGVKFYQNASSFKKTLGSLEPGNKILAGQLAGDFVLPKNPDQKLVFIAGGIGITPFRSMVKYLLDFHQKREVTLFYSNKIASEIAYKEVFDQAEKEFGIRTIYALTDKAQIPQGWAGKIGYIDEKMIKAEVPDYLERKFYLSGPRAMVKAFEETLEKMGVKKSRIKTDFFPGFA